MTQLQPWHPRSVPGGTGILPWFSIRAEGAAGDGNADDTAAIVSARNKAAAAGGGTVYAPAGIYKTTAELSWPSNVSLVGDGWRLTTFRPTGADLNFIRQIGTVDAPLSNCTFRDFEIDGSLLTQSGAYQSGRTKGIFAQFLDNCVFAGLYIHDTGASGLGTDFLRNCHIDGVLVEGCGRLNDGTGPGGSGIGIGTGGFPIESVTITRCRAINNVRYGIFLEHQSAVANASMYAKITDCHTEGGQIGIGDCGNLRSVIVGNSVTGATVAGFAADDGTVSLAPPGRQFILAHNQIHDCAGAPGVLLAGDRTPNGEWSVKHNRISGCDQGVLVRVLATDISGVVIDDNDISGCAHNGVKVQNVSTGTLRDSQIKRNRVYNNGTAASGTDIDGIKISTPCVGVAIEDNRCFDNQTTKTQRYGITVGPNSFTGGSIANNDARGNKTGTVNLAVTPSATTRVAGNAGSVPPAPAAVAVGASPWTHTAGEVPEWLYLSGGAVSSVTIGGQQVTASTDVALPLEPGDQAVVTYTAAPAAAVRSR